MNPVQIHARPYSPDGDSWSGRLVALQHAHATILSAMNEMDQVTRETKADGPRYMRARVALAQASLARRSIWNAIYPNLIESVNAQDAQCLRELWTADIEMLHRSAAHVAKWIPATIERNWSSYCDASLLIRSQMLEQINAEKALLYPLLRRCKPCLPD